MALVHTNTTVGTTPTLICQLPTGLKNTAVQIQNRDSVAIFVGDANITAASGANGGHTIAATSGSLQIWMNSGDKLYAISAAGTSAGAVSVIYSGI